MPVSRRALLAVAASGFFAAHVSGALAQADWKPTKDVEFVIPFAVGGGADLMARVIHKVITEEKLVPVPMALINQPGGGGAVGHRLRAASRKADPHTLILINGTTQITPILNPSAQDADRSQADHELHARRLPVLREGRRPLEDRRRLRHRREVKAAEDLRLLHRRHHRRHGDHGFSQGTGKESTWSASTAAARR